MASFRNDVLFNVSIDASTLTVYS